MLVDSKGENRGSELEKNKWIADLAECLRTYDILGLWRDAEDVIRQEVVRNFVKKVHYFSQFLRSQTKLFRLYTQVPLRFPIRLLFLIPHFTMLARDP